MVLISSLLAPFRQDRNPLVLDIQLKESSEDGLVNKTFFLNCRHAQSTG